jgi:hypothetical protein
MNKRKDQQVEAQTSNDRSQPETPDEGLSRRDFLKSAGSSGAFAAAMGMGLTGTLMTSAPAQADEVGPLRPNPRRVKAFKVRTKAAQKYLKEKEKLKKSNGDEERYDDKRANFFKGLPQNELGEVDLNAYAMLLKALDSGKPADFEAVPLSPLAERRLVNPQAAYAFDMTGVDSHATDMPPAPNFDSAMAAAEIGEIYWMAITRDVPYRHYDTDPLIADAVADLNVFSETIGPKENGLVTPGTLFRGDTPGDLTGPWINQFLWLDIPYGASTIEQRYFVPLSGVNFMTDYTEWLAIQRGAVPTDSVILEATPRYINNMRAMSEYVHRDVAFQPFFNAAMIITSFGPDALDPANPYLNSANQGGFVTFGGVHVFDLVTKAARIGLQGGWFHKWLVHRRLRPEVFAGRIENQSNGSKDYGINNEILDSGAVASLQAEYGNALLPQAYPEGSPLHPSYPAGHATLSGACATMLKAFFNEGFVIPEPVEASSDGLSLEPWTGENLLLGNEINKLASNIGVGRCGAGIHYRSDGAGLEVGEAQAIGILRDYSKTYNEDFAGFTLTKFAGEKIRIVDGKVLPA